MQLDLLTQPRLVFGETTQQFLQTWPFTVLFAQEELAVSQFDDGLGVGLQGREAAQVAFGGDAFTQLPAFALIDQQHGHHGRRVQIGEAGQEVTHVDALALTPMPPQLRVGGFMIRRCFVGLSHVKIRSRGLVPNR